ncbi:MAG: hypothetical protein M3502_00200 [Actinomycetota bacterium]|nr:hypothetical protein [Actinomycetota bacterium]
MLGLLASIRPFAAGASVTPTILLLQLRYCGGAQGSRATGAIFAAVLLVVTGLARAGRGDRRRGQLFDRRRNRQARARTRPRGLRAVVAAPPRRPAGGLRLLAARESAAHTFAVGVAMMATNFTSLTLYFPAIHEIVGAHERTLLPALTFAFAAYLAVQGLVKLA